MLAATTDSTAALKMLLEAGADIHATDDVRCSALLRLCKEAAAQQYMSPRLVTGIGKIVTESAAAAEPCAERKYLPRCGPIAEPAGRHASAD
jgi:hypothetical protein